MKNIFGVVALFLILTGTAAAADKFEYRLLATSKTSTMEKELNEAGEAGYAMVSVMAGQTALGGNEVVVVMSRKAGEPSVKHQYKLLATTKTSTLEKELRDASADGFEYLDNTVFSSNLGGREVSVILERTNAAAQRKAEYKVLAGSRTSTLQKELSAAGNEGFECVGLIVGATALGGREAIAILRR